MKAITSEDERFVQKIKACLDPYGMYTAGTVYNLISIIETLLGVESSLQLSTSEEYNRETSLEG